MTNPSSPTVASSLAIFCKVVDNYGDIGICWRLARQLEREHGLRVTLWVDDLASFARLCPEVDTHATVQQIAGVTVHHWVDQEGTFTPDAVADIVIEFFACDIPPGYIAAMAECEPRPVWLNLEGLTAETWVEGCHGLPSPHPRLPLIKHFYFPGFTGKTGGLLREATLEAERRQFQADPASSATFLAQFGVTPAEMASIKLSLFCYPDAPLPALLEVWQNATSAMTCLVPEGVAVEAIEAFLGTAAKAGVALTRGMLTVRVLPFMAQPDYDKLLWACDLNFVRGEDSFVRAQWAGKPFVWHIYPQEENLHHRKLTAFLQAYAAGFDSLRALALRWNGAPTQHGQITQDWQQLWAAFLSGMPALTRRASEWERQMQENGDLAGNLLLFAIAQSETARKVKV